MTLKPKSANRTDLQKQLNNLLPRSEQLDSLNRHRKNSDRDMIEATIDRKTDSWKSIQQRDLDRESIEEPSNMLGNS